MNASYASEILAALGHAVIAVDLDGRVQYWNPAAERLYGYPAAYATGRPLSELIIAPDQRADAAKRRDRIVDGEAYQGDWQVQDRSGRIFTVSVTSTPLVGADGAQLGSVGVSIDVSARRRDEERARHLASIVENSDDAIADADLDGIIRSANPAVGRLFGCEPDDLIGQPVSVLAPAELAAAIEAARAVVLAGGPAEDLAISTQRPDGRTRHLSLRLSPVRDGAGTIVGISGSARDISAEVQTRTELAGRERMFRARFDQVGTPQALISLSGRLAGANDALCRLLGRERSELRGAPLRAFVHPTDSGAGDAGIAELLRGDADAATWERLLLAPDGSALPVLVQAAVLRDADRVPYGIATFLHDLTGLRAAERALTRREAMFRALAQRASDLAMVVDADANITYVSAAVTATVGYTPDQVLGHNGWDFVHPDDVAATRVVFDRVAGTPGSCETVVLRVADSGGRWRWAEEVMTNCLDDPDIAGIVCNLRDVTARVETEHALRQSEARYRAIAETAQEGIWAIDPTGRTLYANRKTSQLLGIELTEVYERNPAELLSPADPDCLRDQLQDSVRRGAEEYELTYPHPDGRPRVLRLSVGPLRDDTGQTGALAMIADVTDARRAEQELARRALRDELTGLANRALLVDRLEQALVRGSRADHPVAVLVAGLDQFKLINDSWGHAAGDDLLISVGQRMTTAVRAQDTVARFSGDEFVVVCEDSDEAAARRIADRLLAALAEPFDVGGQRVHVRASVGLAVAPPHSGTDLLRFAEAAMYDAKAHGRGRVQVFDRALAGDPADRLALSNDLRDALARDELRLHYQPVVNLADGRLLGVEGLARWTHPVRGAVPPCRFVAVAEADGFAAQLDRWALDRARRDAAALRRAMPHRLHVAVNISAAHLTDPGLEEAVLSVLGTGQLSAGELLLEITESAMMDNLDAAGEVLRRLRARGVAAAIDDFGTGYSSLSYLNRLPVASVKIDRSFVESIGSSPDSLAITASIVRLARALRLTTIAEGVETPEQLTLLRELGCTAAQGYLFSPAVPPADLGELVRSQPGGTFDVGLARR